jgi:hypothetical protein
MNEHSCAFALRGFRFKFEQARRITKVLSVVLAGIGMSALSTHNAFSQVQVAPLTPAGQSRPAGVPENYVITPNGYFHPSCVIEVKEKETVRADGNIQHVDGSIENVSACGYQHYTGRGEILTGAQPHGETITGASPPPFPSSQSWMPPPAPSSQGWIESESVTTGGSFGELTASWVVPPTPPSNDGQTLYFFPGMENSNDVISIIQPVLGYTGGWTIASWNCCVSGTTYHSSFVQVNPGDAILGTIRSTCAAGVLSCATWNITTEDETLGSSTTLSNSSSDGQTFNWAFGGVMEVYAVAKCTDYPANGGILFFGLGLYDYNFNQVTPGWSFTNWSSGVTPQCDYGGAVDSSTEVTLDYNSASSNYSTMTEGSVSRGGTSYYGYYPGIGIGSLSPPSLIGDNTIVAWYDVVYSGSPTQYNAVLDIGSFSADPGAGWLVSATCGGVTALGSAAQYYSYNSGSAGWQWKGAVFPFHASGTIACNVVHH